jgi:hypothetical protein
MIGLKGSRGGLKVVALRTAARRGEPGDLEERYEVAVPRKSPRPDKCGWTMIEMVIVQRVGLCSGDDEIEY